MRSLAVYFAVSPVAFSAICLCATPVCAQVAPITNQTRQVLEFYGGRSAIRTLSEMPQRTAIQPTTSGQISYNGKPFQSTRSGQTISPYLQLFRDEEERPESVPSYFTFVRPQLEQQAAGAQQQREMQDLQRHMHSAQPIRTSAVPGVGTQARYMDTAQFYGGWQR